MMLVLLALFIISLLIFTGWSSLIFSFTMGVVVCLSNLNASFSTTVDIFTSDSNISNLMVLLSCFLCFLAISSSWEFSSFKVFVVSILSLSLVLVLAFSSKSVLSFYIFFEISLIPTLLLIVGWGYQPERLQAGFYMMIYTVAASLPLFLSLVKIGDTGGSFELSMMNIYGQEAGGVIVIVLLLAFLVKLPMYGFHLWLPKAHVEAPLAGSMILAGVLLKLGGYGIYLLSFMLVMYSDQILSGIICISLWGGFIAGCQCIQQTDMKSFVAYSSVSHMSIVVAGLLMDSSWGVLSSVTTMMAHGFSSSALFCMAYFMYKTSNTRNIPYMSGALQGFPAMTLWWFIFCCINMACPPTLNLVGELTVVPVLWRGALSLALVMGLMVFQSAAYNLFLYICISHGGYNPYMFPAKGMKSSMFISMVTHTLPLLALFKFSLFIFI